MKVLSVRNVHEALPEAIHLMNLHGLSRESRFGPVLALPEPVTTVYQRPRERVLFWPERDANPFFHFYEALWMLGGRQDLASLTEFVKRMRQFSTDGRTFHGAYGHRWRRYFDFDQLQAIRTALAADHTDRRQVLQIWDARGDLREQKDKVDIPCNLVVHFQVVSERLNMTVFCRSNDIIWGCYGANAVHFSMLQEFMAAAIGVPVGRYWQVSDNWHAYTATFAPLLSLGNQRIMPPDAGPPNPYDEVEPYPLVNTPIDTWLGDLEMFLDVRSGVIGYRDPFFRHVAVPMLLTHDAYRKKNFMLARWNAERIRASDWRRAVEQWLERREKRHGR